MAKNTALRHSHFLVDQLLKEINLGTMALPYFQRDFVWSKDQMASLLASMFLGLPMGSVLVLESDENVEPEFLFRTIEGVRPNTKSPRHYLLDGQQRLTSLFSIFADLTMIDTRRHNLNARWFLDVDWIMKRMPGRWYEFTFSDLEPEDAKDLFVSYSKSQAGHLFDEFENETFKRACVEKRIVPLDLYWPTDREAQQKTARTILKKIVLSEVALDPSIDSEDDDVSAEIDDWVAATHLEIQEIFKIQIPSILFSTSDFQKAIQAFEIVNQGGTRLHVFDLLVARAGRAYVQPDSQLEEINEGESKVEDFYQRVQQFMNPHEKGAVKAEATLTNLNPDFELSRWDWKLLGLSSEALTKQVKDHIVNALTVTASRGSDIKNSYFFKGKTATEAARLLADNVEIAMERLVRAFAFLQLRCGLPSLEFLPYRLIMLPIAANLTDDVWGDRKKLDLIEAWYWVVTLSGRYAVSQSEVTANEVGRLKKLLSGEIEIEKESVQADSNSRASVRDVLSLQDILNLPGPRQVILHDSLAGSEVAILQRGVGFDYIREQGPADSIYKVIQMFTLRHRPHDWFHEHTLKPWDRHQKLEDHHIIPLGSVKNIKDSSQQLRKSKENPLNSILNRTLISSTANRKINSMGIQSYIGQISPDKLEGHFIPDLSSLKTQLMSGTDIPEGIETFLRKRFEKIRTSAVSHVRRLIE